MLTALPAGLKGPDTEQEIPQRGAHATAEPPLEHLCQLCPNCCARLAGHRCKLVCGHCGYYMSCADYY